LSSLVYCCSCSHSLLGWNNRNKEWVIVCLWHICNMFHTYHCLQHIYWHCSHSCSPPFLQSHLHVHHCCPSLLSLAHWSSLLSYPFLCGDGFSFLAYSWLVLSLLVHQWSFVLVVLVGLFVIVGLFVLVIIILLFHGSFLLFMFCCIFCHYRLICLVACCYVRFLVMVVISIIERNCKF